MVCCVCNALKLMSKCWSVWHSFIYNKAERKYCQQQLSRSEMRCEEWECRRIGPSRFILPDHSFILRRHINIEVTCEPCPAAATTAAVHTAALCRSWSEIDVFIYVGECRSTKLFIISIPQAVWTNKLFQANNSAIGGRYVECSFYRELFIVDSSAEQNNSGLIYITRMKSSHCLVKEH